MLRGCQHSQGELDSTTPFPSGHVSYHRQHCTLLNISDYMKFDIFYSARNKLSIMDLRYCPVTKIEQEKRVVVSTKLFGRVEDDLKIIFFFFPLLIRMSPAEFKNYQSAVVTSSLRGHSITRSQKLSD